MPKRVDHQARREQITEAVFRLIAAHGMEAISLRDVAAEAGVSMGLVQHYFRSKDEMLHFAMDSLGQRVARRFAARIARLPAPRTVRTVLRTAMFEVIPMDEESRADACVSMAFFARALVEPGFAAVLREAYPSMLGAVSEQLRRAIGGGELPPETDPEQEAINLYALTQGLLGPLLIGHYDPAAAAAAIDHHLDRLFRTSSTG
ncbi:TetR/AcrR family transcriptional regulator [Rugosimonospora acidiphila]|uniref:TetR/AcrR family transcriptional regulator n=1 Tax=Rugosimonospora acidiphila TaxID=556531 RepID=A0ABP9RS36_9ACTN